MNEQTINISGQEKAIKKFLHNYLDKQKDEQTIYHILAELGGYYHADRSYMIERNTERTVSSREWCCKDILAETGKLRDIPVDEWECWVEELREKGDFFYLFPAGGIWIGQKDQLYPGIQSCRQSDGGPDYGEWSSCWGSWCG